VTDINNMAEMFKQGHSTSQRKTIHLF